MKVTEALAKRRSIRAFLPTPVEKEKLLAVCEAAKHTPSWANSQPWEVFIAAGDTLARIKKGYGDSYASHAEQTPDTPRPTAWSEAAIQRREQLHPDMQRDCGEAVKQFGKLNQTMFGAPAVIYLCMDNVLSEWSLYDIGAYAQSFMLAATEMGLGTIPAMTLTLFPEILHRELNIPGNLKITIGIAIGYEDTENAINRFASARVPVAENVRLLD